MANVRRPGDALSDEDVQRALLQPENRQLRVRFAQNVVKALKGDKFKSQKKLWDAIHSRRYADQFDDNLKSLVVANWQHLYNGTEPPRLASMLLCRRLLIIVSALLPEYKDRLRLLVYENPRSGAGKSYPPAFRVSMGQALEDWLEKGKAPSMPAVAEDGLAGEYEAYFPWLEACMPTGKVAKARARVMRSDGIWSFQSACNAGGQGALLFAGQLRFTGSRSVVLVGFTSFPLPSTRRNPVVFHEHPEMLVHPYRVPSRPEEWWHGSTAFIDTGTLEYAGTVGHVMRRVNPTVPDDDEWHESVSDPTPLLDRSRPEHDEILREIDRCFVSPR